MSRTMTVMGVEMPGGPEALVPLTREVPQPGPGELLIRVLAAGVNRPDVMQRLGRYPPPKGASDIPGLEVAGIVDSLGPGVTGFAAGDRVCALLAGGGYAEYAVAPAPQCLPVPAGLSMVEAAGIPETFFTVWTNVFERGRLQSGEWLLVHGGASGIGTAAIQMARARGSKVLATAGTPEKCRACEALGAVRGIDYREEDFLAVTLQQTGGRGVDVVLDMVGSDYTPRNLDALAVEGRLVQIAFLRGSRVELDLSRILVKRLTLTGSSLRPRSVEQKGAIAAALHREIWPLLESGAVKVVVHATFPLRQVGEAHRQMEAGLHTGKLILTVAEEATP